MADHEHEIRLLPLELRTLLRKVCETYATESRREGDQETVAGHHGTANACHDRARRAERFARALGLS